MTRGARFRIALLLVLAILTICISPATDLQPTALRSVQVANMLFAALALAGSLTASGFGVVFILFSRIVYRLRACELLEDLLSLNCTRLC